MKTMKTIKEKEIENKGLNNIVSDMDNDLRLN